MELSALTLKHIEKDETLTLDTFRENKPLVLDFWHTKCVKCPAALSKLDAMVTDYPGVFFASCAVSLSDGDDDMVAEMVEDTWEVSNFKIPKGLGIKIKSIFTFIDTYMTFNYYFL